MSAAPSPISCSPIPDRADPDPQGADHAGRPVARRRRRHRRAVRCATTCRAETIDHVLHGTTIGTNAVLENRWRGDRDDHHRRLSRHRPYRAAPAAAALFDPPGSAVAGPAAGPPAPPADGGGTAGSAEGRGAGAARRGGGARGGPRAARRRCRGDRDLLSVLLPQPGARGARATSCARKGPTASSAPRPGCRRSSASSNVSPRRCSTPLSGRGSRTMLLGLDDGLGAAGCRRSPRHVLQWRRGDRGDGRPQQPGADPALGTGGRRISAAPGPARCPGGGS